MGGKGTIKSKPKVGQKKVMDSSNQCIKSDQCDRTMGHVGICNRKRALEEDDDDDDSEKEEEEDHTLKCRYCSRQFTQSSNCRRHERNLHVEKKEEEEEEEEDDEDDEEEEEEYTEERETAPKKRRGRPFKVARIEPPSSPTKSPGKRRIPPNRASFLTLHKDKVAEAEMKRTASTERRRSVVSGSDSSSDANDSDNDTLSKSREKGTCFSLLSNQRSPRQIPLVSHTRRMHCPSPLQPGISNNQ
jgi:hypothetical protein